MNVLKQINWTALIATPLVVGLFIGGIWFSVSASIENYKSGRASDQILGIVARARDLRFLKKVSAEEMQETLINKLTGFDNMALAVGGSRAGQKSVRGLEDPWGQFLAVQIAPNLGAMRLQISLSSVACRKMLNLFSADARSMGLVRVDVRDNAPSALWRLVYEESEKEGAAKTGIPEVSIDAGCGHKRKTAVSLMFKL